MATEMQMEKDKLIQNTFRRASITKGGGALGIETDRMAEILGQMGQPFCPAKLREFIAKIDPQHTGYLDHDAYNKLCKEFVTEPAALAKIGGNEFLFKQLISGADFAYP